ncbi:hypothetical protein ACHAXA_005975 [Cyclostephanos tholiformis]|uniref:Uncharacterized protein n=1 Tax=Cyclostephanos tholiformis TaxID=382380 RepID=A0ABD3SEC5_9STRA
MQSAAGQKRKRGGGEVEVVVCPSAFPDFSTVGGPTSRGTERRSRSVAREQRRDDRPRGGRVGGGRYYANDDGGVDGSSPPTLDVQETIREVHKFGSTGFTGSMKRSHEDAEYARLTGRTTKRQKIPTRIIVGMRKKAMKREERKKNEERESGVVGHHSTTTTSRGMTTTTTTTTKKKKRDKRPRDDGGGGVGPRGVFGSNRARNTGDRRKMSSRSFGPSPDVGFMLKGILKVKQSPVGR